jgi:glycosyltransferase involved in cell wall biosynthesis
MTTSPGRPQLIISGAHLFNPYVGVGVYTVRLVRALARAERITFKVLIPEAAESIRGELPAGCGVIVPGSLPPKTPELLRTLYWMDRIAATAVREYPGSIFHSTGSFWSRHRPRRTVVTLHDCLYRRFPFYLGRFPMRRWLTYASERYAKQAALVLTVSQSAAADLEQLAHFPASQIKVIYNWVEDRFNRESARQDAAQAREIYSLPAEFILYVGGYDYRKNVEFLIQAYAEARSSAPLPPLVLAGSIPGHLHRTLGDVRGALARAGLREGSEVFLPGRIADADMPGLYAAARLLVYPSLYEGFGFPPIEAIACGTPALVADNSSLVEVVPEARNRFSTDDTKNLARLLGEATRAPADFHTALNPEFTEAAALANYLAALESMRQSEIHS